MKSKFALISLGFCAILAGCAGAGGDGGGGTTATMTSQWLAGGCSVSTGLGSISYSADWGSAPASASVVVQVISSSNQVVRTESYNRSAGQPSLTASITDIPSGIYELRATLYSTANATGTVLGVASLPVDLCTGGSPTAQARTTFAATAGSMRIFPDNFSLSKNRTTRFVPTLTASNGQAVFVAANGVTWSVTNAIGTIDNAGNFTATVPGKGQVRGVYSAASLSAATDVTVTDVVVERKKWTVMVYMNAANDLYFASDLNVNQMEQVANNPDVRFVVQWKQSKTIYPASSFDGVRRVLVKPDTSNAVVSEVVQSNLTNSSGNALDMGSPQTMADFIKWSKANYPADRYVLVVWNHGNGWKRSRDAELGRAVSYDDQYNTSIKTWQTDAMMGGEHVDILAWDASLMQMLEVAYEARNSADYVVGSEESPPAEGFPYHLVFKGFRDNPSASTSELAKGFVDGMLGYSPYNSRKITQSVLDTTKLTAVGQAVSDLGVALQAAGSSMASDIANVRDQAQTYSQTGTRYYRDLIHLATLLQAAPSATPDVKVKANAVINAAAAAIIYEGHNSNSANSRGLAIDFSPGPVFAGSLESDYKALKFGQDFNWDEFLKVAP